MTVMFMVQTVDGVFAVGGDDMSQALHEGEQVLGDGFAAYAEEVLAQARAVVGDSPPSLPVASTAAPAEPSPRSDSSADGEVGRSVATEGDARPADDQDVAEAQEDDQGGDEGVAAHVCVICDEQVTADRAEVSMDDFGEVRCKQCSL